MITPDAVLDHYLTLFGEATRMFRYTGDGITTDVAMFEARPATGDVALYATIGRTPGSEVHRDEFFIGLRPAVDQVAIQLAGLADYRRLTGEALGHGHTVPLDSAPWPGTDMRAFLMIEPRSLALAPLRDDVSHVRFLQVMPLFQVERRYKMAHGTEALIDAWRERAVRFHDPYRLLDPGMLT